MPESIVTILPLILGSSLLTTVLNNFYTGYRDRRRERKELVAKANASVLRRVELCYRIRRRAKGEETFVKNLTHDVQEENEYYKCLLRAESRWYGDRYALYLDAVKTLTSKSMYKAWTMNGNPSAIMEEEIKLDRSKLEELSKQFSLDSRRFLCPIRKLGMAIHDMVRKVNKYDL